MCGCGCACVSVGMSVDVCMHVEWCSVIIVPIPMHHASL